MSLHVVVSIKYFSKGGCKTKSDKSAPKVAQFLYELICKDECFAIEINDQGREFVNKVSDNLNEMTGTREQITWAYHPQSNDLIESQNRAIKNVLEKALDEKKTLINGHVIWRVSYLQHGVSRHSSTKYSPLYLMYNREPELPVDLQLWACRFI